ncbi:MAG: carbohydrate kinase [Kiritimatiellaeota bacterium]|nr:carbohydrate kinase [Kiritimatiellota bacterium]
MSGKDRFLGLDSSTQSLSAVLVDLDGAEVVAEASVNFEHDLAEYNCPQGVLPNANPLVKHSDPLMWAAALDALLTRMRDTGVDFSRLAGISGSGQQHGTVYLKHGFLARRNRSAAPDLAAAVRPFLSRRTSPIWMDSSTGEECAEITHAVGGPEEMQRRSGSPAVERFSGPQIRKFWKEATDSYEDTSVIHLVSSFMASLLTGVSAPIDFGDGAGMNLMNLADGAWDPILCAATAPGLAEKLPELVPSDTIVGPVSAYFVERYGVPPDTPVVVWSGDNPNSLIGVGGWAPGTPVISLGTSDTFFAAMREPRVDPQGYGHVFGNPAGGFMSLICFKNGALAREAVRDRFGLDWAGFETLLARTPPGNNGNMMLPYFIPEITPLVLEAGPVYVGTDEFREGRDAPAVVRAVIEAQAARLRLHSEWIEGRPTAVRVTGGGAANTGICRILADMFGVLVQRLDVGNSAALGAAMRAAQAVSGVSWQELSRKFAEPAPGGDVLPTPEIVRLYEADFLPKYRTLAGVK